jgi:hypothetical protein
MDKEKIPLQIWMEIIVEDEKVATKVHCLETTIGGYRLLKTTFTWRQVTLARFCKKGNS